MNKFISTLLVFALFLGCSVIPGEDSGSKSSPLDNNSYRLTRDGSTVYTYDENGFVITVEILRWGKRKEVFQVSNGRRIGSETFYYDDVDKVFETLPSRYSSINHDASNREISHLYYEDAAKTVLQEEIYIDYTTEPGKKIVTYYEYDFDDFGELMRVKDQVRTYDQDGNLLSQEDFHNISFWTSFYGVSAVHSYGKFEAEVNSIKGVYEYSSNSRKKTKESFYVDGVLELETTMIMKDNGVYQHGVVKKPDGLIVGEIHFGKLYEYGDLKAQSAYINVYTSSNNIEIQNKEHYTELYDKNFIDCGSLRYPKEKEVGVMAEGQFVRPSW